MTVTETPGPPLYLTSLTPTYLSALRRFHACTTAGSYSCEQPGPPGRVGGVHDRDRGQHGNADRPRDLVALAQLAIGPAHRDRDDDAEQRRQPERRTRRSRSPRSAASCRWRVTPSPTMPATAAAPWDASARTPCRRRATAFARSRASSAVLPSAAICTSSCGAGDLDALLQGRQRRGPGRGSSSLPPAPGVLPAMTAWVLMCLVFCTRTRTLLCKQRRHEQRVPDAAGDAERHDDGKDGLVQPDSMQQHSQVHCATSMVSGWLTGTGYRGAVAGLL